MVYKVREVYKVRVVYKMRDGVYKVPVVYKALIAGHALFIITNYYQLKEKTSVG